MVVGFIGRDPKKPRFEPAAGRAGIKAIYVIQHRQPRLLVHLLGHVLAASQPVQVPRQRRVISFDQQFPRDRIAVAEAQNQRFVRFTRRLGR